MDLASIRNKTGLDKRGFLRRLTPHLKGFSLDEFMLTRMENGESFQQDRSDAIFSAFNKAFPELVDSSPQSKTQSKKFPTIKISGIVVGSIFLGLFLVFMVVVYLVFPENEYLKNLDRFLAAIGTSVTVVGFVVGLYLKSNK